jgi:hypothetical protein
VERLLVEVMERAVLVEQVYNHQLMEQLLITLPVVGEYEVITLQPWV